MRRTHSMGIALLWLLCAGCRGYGCEPERATSKPKTTPAASGGAGSPLRSPLDAKDTAGAKQRFVELIRHNLNRRIHNPEKEGRWDFWSEGSTRYPLANGERAYLMSFRRYSARSQEGFLVIGTIAGQHTTVHGYWSVPAGIDDIHVMDMGKAGPMIYTVSFDTTGRNRRVFHHLLRFDGTKINEVWSYKLGYALEHPKTYKPVTVTFRDEDGDGTREVRIRIPAETPRLWKRRWAMFKWNAPHNEFRPLRGLAFTPVSLQKPLWAAAGFLEAVRTRARKDSLRFAATRRGCRSMDDLWETLVRRGYKRVGTLRRKRPVNPDRSRRAWILADLERKADTHRYLAELELIREGRGYNGWRICQVRFFRL